MAAGRASFEIQTYRDDHWITGDLRETESGARAVARSLFAVAACQGVRIIKNWERSDGIVTETVVHREMRELAAEKVTISPIEDAPFCRKIEDYYSRDSRATINRLLRKYIEKNYLTPTELLHHYKSLKRFLDADNLFPSAVDRVSTLQGRVAGEDARARREALFGAGSGLAQRARKIDDHPSLPPLKGTDFAKVVDAVARLVPKAEVAFYATGLLCRDLVLRRNWLGKFDRLVELIGATPRADALDVLDAAIADIVGQPTGLQDILGYHRNLALALCAVADLYEGRFAGEKSDAREQIAMLNPLLAAGRLEQTRAALADWMARQLAGSQPLNRYEPGAERAAFAMVAERLQCAGGFLGGPLVGAALARRSALVFGNTVVKPPPDESPEVEACDPSPNTDAAYLAELATLGDKKASFPPGSLIFKEGAAAECAYMVLSGSVEVSTVNKGQRVMLTKLIENEMFGELALIQNTTRSATVTTVEGCELRVIDKADLDRKVDALDPFCRYWTLYLIDVVKDLSKRAGPGKKRNLS